MSYVPHNRPPQRNFNLRQLLPSKETVAKATLVAGLAVSGLAAAWGFSKGLHAPAPQRVEQTNNWSSNDQIGAAFAQIPGEALDQTAKLMVGVGGAGMTILLGIGAVARSASRREHGLPYDRVDLRTNGVNRVVEYAGPVTMQDATHIPEPDSRFAYEPAAASPLMFEPQQAEA